MASIFWQDEQGFAELSNLKPAPAGRFFDWNPDAEPFQAAEVALGTGLIDAFTFREDYLVSFEIRGIPKSELSKMLRLQTHLLDGYIVAVECDHEMNEVFAYCALAPETVPKISFSDRQMLEYTFGVKLKAIDIDDIEDTETRFPPMGEEGDCLTPNSTTTAATSGLSPTKWKGDDFSAWALNQYEDFREDTVDNPNYENGTRSHPYTTHPLVSLPSFFWEFFDDASESAVFPYTPPGGQVNRNRISQLAVNGGHRTVKAVKTADDYDDLFNGFEIWAADTPLETDRFTSMWARLRFQYSANFPLGSPSDTSASFGGVYLFSSSDTSPGNCDVTVATGTLTNPSSKLTISHKAKNVVGSGSTTHETVLGDTATLVTTGTPRELVVFAGLVSVGEYRVAVWMGDAFGALTKLYDATFETGGFRLGRHTYFMRSKNVYHVPEGEDVICYECISWELEDGNATPDPYGVDS